MTAVGTKFRDGNPPNFWGQIRIQLFFSAATLSFCHSVRYSLKIKMN